MGFSEHSVNHRVDNLFIDIYRGIFVLVSLVNLSDGFTEETVRNGQNVRLVSNCDSGLLVNGRRSRISKLLSAESNFKAILPIR